MADITLIIESNADLVAREVSGIGTAAQANIAKVVALEKSMRQLDDIKNKANGTLSIQQYSNAMNKLQTELDQTVAKLGQFSAAEEQAAAKAQKAANAAKQLAMQVESLRDKYVKGHAAGKQLALATKEINTALSLGLMTSKQAKAAIAALGLEYQRAGKNSVQFAAMQRMAGKSTNKFGMYSQQVGYQVGDFAVQVQSGTNALVAFGQQGTQLAGLLPGIYGAALGIGLAIGTAVARSVMDAKKLEIDFRAVLKELAKPLENIKPILNGISSAFSGVGNVAVSVLSTLANNLDRVILIATVAATAFGTYLVYGLIAAKVATFTLTGAFKLLGKAILATGIGIIVIAVAEAIRIFMMLKEQLAGVGPVLDLLKRAFFEVLDKIGNRFTYLRDWIKLKFEQAKMKVLEVLSELIDKVNSNFVNNFIGAFAGAVAAVAEIVKTIPSIFVAVFKNVQLVVVNGINNFTGAIGRGVNKLLEAVNAPTITFGQTLDTTKLEAGNVDAVLAASQARIQLAYTEAYAVDRVTAAQNTLRDAMVKSAVKQIDIRRGMSDLDIVYASNSTALLELAQAYDDAKNANTIDFNAMLRPATDKDKDKSSKKSDPIGDLKRQIALNKEIVNVTKEKAAVITEVRNVQRLLAEEGKTYDAQKLVALVVYNNELKKQRQEQQAMSEFIASAMETAFMKMIDGTTSVADAFKSMAAEIIKELYRVMVVQQMVADMKAALDAKGGIIKMVSGLFGGGSANGNVFSGGSQVEAYANGGVVSGPTNFPMSGNKIGLMGEAGPEAIMPLKRGSNGKLGVQAEGNRGGDVIHINQSFNFQANGDETVKKLIAQAAPKIADMAKASVVESRRRGGSTKAAFG